MVPRQLIRRGRAAGVVSVAIAVLAGAATADASNRRVSISNYQWSDPTLELDLGEHVTWYWVGPDIMHSVTGESPNARGIDSDPGIDLPEHQVGDSFQVTFDQPGTYQLVCKLHSTVRGEVTVSDSPGDPASEQDPVPKSQVDLKAPKMRSVSLASNPIRGRGGQLHFNLGERAKVDADYFRLGPGGKRKFAGWAKWSAYVGLNEIRFGARGKHFHAEPGRYVAELRATDRDQNTSAPRRVRFRISPAD
ncbi:MAG: plastocyanin/azurin family copper-binding protein [Solirubrobacterales bacterium]